MLIDISTSKTPTKAFLREKITPLLPARIRPSFLEAVSEENPQKVKAMPNSFLPPHMQGGRSSKEGVLLAGDALNMRHPLTGGGMSVALNDAVILTELLGGGRPLTYSSAKAQQQSPDDAVNGNGDGYMNGDSKEYESDTLQANGNGNDKGYMSSSSSSILSRESNDSNDSSSFGDRDVCEIQDWWDVRSRLEEWHWRRKGVATCVNVLAMALYCLFGAEGEFVDILKISYE